MKHQLQWMLPLIGLILVSCQTPPDRFDQADLDGDGKLSRDEVYDYLVTSIFVTRDANKDQLMTQEEWGDEGDGTTGSLFAKRDTNKDSMVSMEEAKAYAKRAKTFDEAVKEADTNHDGFLSREEVVAYYGSKEGPVR